MAKNNNSRGINANLGGQNADSFFNDFHKDLRADFLLANPPFNMSDWGGERLRDDARWKYGAPPVNYKIELNRQMNQTLEAMARVIFKSWFVDFDPVCAKAEGGDTGLPEEIADLFPDGFEDSEVGGIPKKWHSAPLAEVLFVWNIKKFGKLKLTG